MQKLTRDDLFNLETYAEKRPAFRTEVIAHKKNRFVPLTDHTSLYFEDRLTIQYQIQEMLRIEKIFESAGIQDELDAYNPLIPDGSNFKATFMIEYPDEAQRKQELARLIGIEDTVWVQVNGRDKVYAIADEDLERETEEKTSSVHFLRFELTPEMIADLKADGSLSVGVDHDNCKVELSPVSAAVRDSLVADLD
jgi:hypothetical protein